MTTELQHKLDAMGVTISATCNGLQKDDHGWHHYEWSCQLIGMVGKGVPVTFRMGTGLVEKCRPHMRGAFIDYKQSGPLAFCWRKPATPTTADLVYSMLLDAEADSQSFEEWCDNFGGDTDSRKSLATYLACQESAAKLARVIPRSEWDSLRQLEH